MSDNGHSEESSNRIRVDNHKVGIQRTLLRSPRRRLNWKMDWP